MLCLEDCILWLMMAFGFFGRHGERRLGFWSCGDNMALIVKVIIGTVGRRGERI